MNIRNLPARIAAALTLAVLSVLNFVENIVEKARDFLNGDVAKVLGQFDAKIERARLIAIREATKVDEQIDALEAQIEKLDAAYDSKIADAERAARIQKLFS
jgi:excinuclease UvrABC nuclease subunit